MKLTVKDLAPYLPYDLKCWVKDYSGELSIPSTNGCFTLNAIYSDCECVFHDLIESQQGFKSIKPVLRPLSDLTKDISANGEDFVPYENPVFVEAMLANKYLEYICEAKADLSEDRLLPYSIVQKLFEWHFDVFGLIEKGLAIDMNTIAEHAIANPNPIEGITRKCAEVVISSGTASVSLLQRKLSLSYTQAAAQMERLESLGIVGFFSGSKNRPVLVRSLDEIIE